MKILSRSEMKSLKAGDGFTRCDCFDPYNGEVEGTALCTGLDLNGCCDLAYDDTLAANCESATLPGEA